MSLFITRSGLLDTIQDAGRYGYQHLGINPGGAMDLVAMRVANALVGNESGEAVLEMHFPAAEIRFEETVLIALSGADFGPAINGESIPCLQPLIVRAGSVLKFTKQVTGTRAVLAVHGGMVTDEWLQSSSTHLKVKAGGYHGRALQKNDLIRLKKDQPVFVATEKSFTMLPWKIRTDELYINSPFPFIPGPEYELLDEPSKQLLQTSSFTIGQQSDRMGYRLQGDALQLKAPKEMISTAVTKGTIQLLPGGQLIILMADHQTTGGYPRVAHITTTSVPSLAQMHAGEKINLQKADLPFAENTALNHERNLQQLQNACIFRLEQYLNK
jgi:antagonist of KipI